MYGIPFSCYLPLIKKRVVVYITEGDMTRGTGYYVLNEDKINVTLKNGNIKIIY